MNVLISLLFSAIFLASSISSQRLLVPNIETRPSNTVTWCTGSTAEQAKCKRFGQAIKQVPAFTVILLCKRAADREKCMSSLDNGEADLLTLDPGEVLVAGRYHSLVPIMAERYGTSKEDGYYSVAVVHGSSDFRNLNDLRDKKACFPGVGQFGGWVLPLTTLIERQVLNITDCNNLVKSASDFFGPSCAPGSLIDKYNPSGDNPQKMCELCRGYKGDRCSGSDPFAQYDGAFKCLQEGGGQVAFLTHSTVQEMTSKRWYRGPPLYDFRLLCPSGITASLDDYHRCNWGYVPANAVVTLSSALPERRKFFQDFLKQSVDYFGSRDSTYNSRAWNTTGYYPTSTTPFPLDRWNNRGQTDSYNSTWSSNYTDEFSRDRNPYDQNAREFGDRQRPRDQFDTRQGDRDQFDTRQGDRDQFNTRQGDRDQFDNRRDQFDKRRDQFDNRRDQFDSRSDQFDGRRDQFDSRRDQWDRRYNSSSGYGPFYNDSNRAGYDRRQQGFGNYSSFGGFLLFDSSNYGESYNLLFQDTCTTLVPIQPSQQTFKGYLGSNSAIILGLRKCPVPPARLCVVSDKEYEKCLRMKTAFKAQMLKPDLSCIRSHSQMSCMALVSDNSADLVLLDSGDIYKAGQHYGLIPIISEQYDLEDSRYYAVAVAVQPDKTTDLLYLKGKRSCHSGIGTGAGWIIPMSFLISSERMRSYGCNAVRAASEFFQKSCLPGALSREYTFGRWGYDNLCDLCHGSSYHYCARESGEPFYGDSGALRCLVEGGGEIAFVRHTTILQNAAGRNPAWWSRPMMPEDFELLCRDGTRAKHSAYRTCNLGSVASNALMTSPYRDATVISAYINLFMYAQQFYGSKYSPDFTFKMFVSEGGFHDLIFQDSTQQLKVVPQDKRNYRTYLGNDFLRAVKMTDCTAGAISRFYSVWFLLLVVSLWLAVGL